MTAAIPAVIVWTCESVFRDAAGAAHGEWRLKDLSVRLFPPLAGETLKCIAARSLSTRRMDIWDVNITRDGSDEPLCLTSALFVNAPT